MRLDSVPLTAETLAHYLIVDVSKAHPRSVLVPSGVTDEVVERMAIKVAADFVAVSARKGR
jgi:hypothetical protein